MGVEHLRARGGLRLSLGRGTTEEDVVNILEATELAVRTVREA
jgi:cysteine sulfinate desulfinase/cysteine desulfurase-like protein